MLREVMRWEGKEAQRSAAVMFEGRETGWKALVVLGCGM